VVDSPVPATPALVTFHLWQVPRAGIPGAIARMALHRGPVRRTPGLLFGKLLGTGNGQTFTVRDADLHHWGLLATWRSLDDAVAFEKSPLLSRWRHSSLEHLTVKMKPLTSRGHWSRRQPFGDPIPHRWSGPIAAVTRARLNPLRTRAFWQAVPEVSRDLQHSPGLRLAIGIGEAPIGLQGTFSLWSSGTALSEFAQRRSPHRRVITRTAEVKWYSEELFARLAVLETTGTFRGQSMNSEGSP
jgi:hypothetical protein